MGRRWYLGAPEGTVTPSLYEDQHEQGFWEPRLTSVLKEGLLHTRSNVIHHWRRPLIQPLHSRYFSAPEGTMSLSLSLSLLVCLSAMIGLLGTTTNFRTQRRPSSYWTQHYTPLMASFDSAIAQQVFQCTGKNYDPLSPCTSISNDRDAGNHNQLPTSKKALFTLDPTLYTTDGVLWFSHCTAGISVHRKELWAPLSLYVYQQWQGCWEPQLNVTPSL